MGGCIGAPRDGSSPNGESSDGNGGITLGRNQPLKPDKLKWKSDVALTEGQLRSKRDEFWDTAPAFEGRKEIWDALKAAAYALETGDHLLAQAIVDGASISLPNGTLLDCYDELGNRYQLPVYVLSQPTNLIEDCSDQTEGADEPPPAPHPGVDIPLKFRLSHTNKDIRMVVRTTDSVLKVKKQIQEQEDIVPARQRWFFGGRLINDKMRIEDAKIPKGCLVQVIVSEPPQAPVES